MMVIMMMNLMGDELLDGILCPISIPAAGHKLSWVSRVWVGTCCSFGGGVVVQDGIQLNARYGK